MNSYDTLSEALSDLEKRGYTHNFNLECDCIVCKSIDLKLNPDGIFIQAMAKSFNVKM